MLRVVTTPTFVMMLVFGFLKSANRINATSLSSFINVLDVLKEIFIYFFIFLLHFIIRYYYYQMLHADKRGHWILDIILLEKSQCINEDGTRIITTMRRFICIIMTLLFRLFIRKKKIQASISPRLYTSCKFQLLQTLLLFVDLQ